MPRAKSRCPKPGCKEFKPCKIHKTWAKSSGQRPLPSDWKSRKKKARGYSDRRCYVCGCVRPNGAVDHVKPRSQGGSDDLSNLAWICDGPGSCHEKKTKQERRLGQKRWGSANS